MTQYNFIQHHCVLYLTYGEKEGTILGESETLHCPPVVGYGITTSSTRDVPNANETLVITTAPCCRRHSLEREQKHLNKVQQRKTVLT